MRRWPRHLGAVIVAVASAVLFTWPLAVNARSHVLGAIFHWDAYTNAMIMASRVDAALGRAPMSIYANYYFAPLPDSIVFNENHFGLSLVFAPFYLISGNGLFAYNMTLLVTFALSVFFTYLLVRHLTGSAWAGVICGVAFAYCPYVFYELGRIQLTATPWIPAAFLFLHRTLERERLKDALGFWLAIVLQIGTCLYYAMFLAPVLSVLGGVLVARYRPSRRFVVRFGAVAAGAGAVALGMVYPYFSARHRYSLDRSLEYASSYDGKFSFFANVHPTNLTLKGMHHVDTTGRFATEIAFPSFTALALALLAVAVPAARALSHSGPLKTFAAIGRWVVLGILALYASLLTHSFLTGTITVGAGVWWSARHPLVRALGGNSLVYFSMLLLAVTMFLGIHPLDWDGEPVRGLYYYFYSYFPGFNGIRHVSRQAVITTFLIVVFAGFGGAWLFSRFRGLSTRSLLGTALLGALCYELRCFPHPLERVWAGDEAPRSLSFAAMLPAHDLLAFLPQAAGREVFRGDSGMALHNILALHHKHRFVNGQSSYEPDVTTLGFRALDALPGDGARRALLSMGAKHLVIFGEDLAAERAGLPDMLSAQPDKFRRIFQDGKDSVFTLLEPEPQSLELLSTPELPGGARLIPQRELRADANLQPGLARLALDGKADSYWTGGRFQTPGQYFEIALGAPRPVIALEIDVPGRVWDVPSSFRLTALNGNADHGVVLERQQVRLYRSQIFDPKNFVFRLVLPRPVTLDRLRITVAQPVPGSYFSIHELRLYEAMR
ncbi:MAG TPA: hypothetical protein VNN72_06485 [Polyangiaceae bacterium]|nr:hypothetical protein [Polyangiaceae bacterium]